MKHPLNINNFTFLDRIKFCCFILNPKNFWTISDQTKKLEEEMATFVGCDYSIFVSSGSTANTILAMYVKDNFYTSRRNQVILPSTTWQTSCSPWIREGFKPKFIDISLSDLSMDIESLNKYLEKNHSRVSCVFITSLIGNTPNIDDILYLKNKYPKIYFALDNCENTFGTWRNKNISSYLTSTTSTYFGHQLSSVEGGFIFTNSKEEYELFCCYRNHGMVRGRSKTFLEKHRNCEVDERFDFCLLGNNFRNSDLHAFLCQLDLKKAHKYIESRKKISEIFYDNLSNPYINMDIGRSEIPFCLPIFCETELHKNKLMMFLKEKGVETRPIISGNLLRQTCYKNYDSYKNFHNSEFVHTKGFYIGLYYGLEEKYIKDLAKEISKVQ